MKALFISFVLFTFCMFGCSSRSRKIKAPKVKVFELSYNRALINFWKEFSLKFNSLDTAAVKRITLDSIWLWGDKVSSREFIKRYYSGYSSTEFLGILDTNKIRYSSIGCYPNPPIVEAIKRQDSDAFNCDQIAIIQDTIGSIVKGIEFTFLETTKGYRLFEINYASYYWGIDNSMVDTTTKTE